ncbi:MAG: ABC transporter substrate-binding protein, partial [Bdellovibrionales bacterium]|nr:ABC transporter substrate-binding protein [Bdellovibrionales bacterium]
TYDPKETDFSGPVQRLVGTYYLEDRVDEYRHALREWQKKAKSLGARKSPPGELLSPVVDFEAIFIPDGTTAVGQVAPMLAYQEVNEVRLLGTNIWNTSGLLRKGERFVEGSIFVDGVFADDSRFKRSAFYRDFHKTFHEEPGLLEAQGYDAGLMIRELIEKGQRTRVGLAENLAELKTFRGSLGTLFMNSSREVERPLVPLTVEKGQIHRWRPPKKAHK